MTTSLPTITFPLPVLTPVNGEPNYASLQLLQSELSSNAMSQFSNRGGGAHGHLGVLLSATEYNTIATNNTPFFPPVHPGPTLVIPLGATDQQVRETTRIYTSTITEYATYIAIGNALKAQIIAAIDRIYLDDVRDPVYNFATVSPLDILDHLHNTYGTIDNDQLDQNQKRLDAIWTPTDPIERVWTNLLECVRFSIRGNDPITETTAVRRTLAMFEQTGLFTLAIRDWRNLPTNQWTLTTMKAHFNKANKERLRQATTNTASYHGANLATENTAYQAATDNANRATARANSAADIALAAAQGRSPTAPAEATSTGSLHYCWTHGLTRSHQGAKCANPMAGHIKTATVNNMQGGNSRIARQKGERAAYHADRTRPRDTPPAST
jgi:hypothetical protein